MRLGKHMLLVAGGAIVFGGLSAAFFIWPAYREAGEITRRIADLDQKAANLDTQNQLVTELAGRLEETRSRVRADLKEIPASPDLAALIRKLSLPVDNRTVHDQEFSAGQPSPAIPGTEGGAAAMPLTVEMKGTFEAVYTLLRAAETMDRLVRVTSIQLTCKRDEADSSAHAAPAGRSVPASLNLDDAPLLSATLGLEAIYAGGDSLEAH